MKKARKVELKAMKGFALLCYWFLLDWLCVSTRDYRTDVTGTHTER